MANDQWLKITWDTENGVDFIPYEWLEAGCSGSEGVHSVVVEEKVYLARCRVNSCDDHTDLVYSDTDPVNIANVMKAGCTRIRRRPLGVSWYDAYTQKKSDAANVEVHSRSSLTTFANRLVRDEQPLFRRQILEAFGGRCAISDTEISETLEAAHIRPYAGKHSNHVSNGIALRRDLHRLFDNGMIWMEKGESVGMVDELSGAKGYKFLYAAKFRLPDAFKDNLTEALSWHRESGPARAGRKRSKG